jgi:hypothetical protein
MNPEIISKAVQNLAEGAEFTFNYLDLDSLVFLNDVEQPTKEQIEAEMVKVIEKEEEEKNRKVTARNAALAKLQSLGITEDDLKALGL